MYLIDAKDDFENLSDDEVYELLKHVDFESAMQVSCYIFLLIIVNTLINFAHWGSNPSIVGIIN